MHRKASAEEAQNLEYRRHFARHWRNSVLDGSTLNEVPASLAVIMSCADWRQDTGATLVSQPIGDDFFFRTSQLDSFARNGHAMALFAMRRATLIAQS